MSLWLFSSSMSYTQYIVHVADTDHRFWTGNNVCRILVLSCSDGLTDTVAVISNGSMGHPSIKISPDVIQVLFFWL